MPLWIPITVFAAFMQNLRFMLQRHLKATQLSTAGATFSRFLFGAPLAALTLVALLVASGGEMPSAGRDFLAHAMTGGVAQILATSCVVALFAERNFTVGITFKKTEALQTALVAYLVLGERVSPLALGAILLGFVGVLLLSDPPRPAPGVPLLRRVVNRASGLGILSGALFGVSAVGYRGASLALGGGDFLIRAATTLAFVTLFQTGLMLLWLAWRDRQQIGRVLRAWRVCTLVGLTSMLGSLGWFAAFTLQHAAYVKALGQVELVFTFLGGWFVFHERSGGRELAGIGLVVASILVLVTVL